MSVHYPLSRYDPVSGSMPIVSPSLIKRGTVTIAPVSVSTVFVAPAEEFPLIPSELSVTFNHTFLGTARLLLHHVIQALDTCHWNANILQSQIIMSHVCCIAQTTYYP